MVISAYGKAALIFIFSFCLVACGSCPTTASNEVFIKHWRGYPLPKTVTLEQYQKNTDFKILSSQRTIYLKTTDFNDISRSLGQNSTGSLFLKFNTLHDLPVDQDYRIVLDSKYEYKISKLVAAEGSANSACPLGGGKVNQCNLESTAGSAISFDRACANVIK